MSYPFSIAKLDALASFHTLHPPPFVMIESRSPPSSGLEHGDVAQRGQQGLSAYIFRNNCGSKAPLCLRIYLLKQLGQRGLLFCPNPHPAPSWQPEPVTRNGKTPLYIQHMRIYRTYGRCVENIPAPSQEQPPVNACNIWLPYCLRLVKLARRLLLFACLSLSLSLHASSTLPLSQTSHPSTK